MKKYYEVEVDCFDFQDMMKIFEEEYKQEYKLIGYQYDSINNQGELVLYPRKGKEYEK